jgi:hypothetical protein
MFGATFLGHQGWLFSAGDARVLVDPILTGDFCDAGNVGQIFPPRQFDFERFPRINAVIITHEHNDHFAIPTLHRIDRKIPVFMSARSSVAARLILGEMGFQVTPLAPGDVVRAGLLEFHAFSPDHRNTDNYDEWDVLPYLVRDRDGHGNFFTHVDAEPDDQAYEAMRAVAASPALWACTNNTSNWSFTKAGFVQQEPVADSAALTQLFLTQYAAIQHCWGSPAGVLCCGGGVQFTGEREWLNRNVFTASSERACAAIAEVVADRLALAPTPGQTVQMVSGKIDRVLSGTEYLRSARRADWPSRDYEGDVGLMDRYSPACGRREFTRNDLPEIVRELDGFACHLYGSGIFRGLYSCGAADFGGHRPTFALVLLVEGGSGAYVFEYNPQACRFSPAVTSDPVGDYLSGMEFWATDFLAICRGELGSSAIPFGRGRVWNARPERCMVSFREFCLYFHPLRRPELFLKLYRTLLQREPSIEPLVKTALA